jgi:hypothetical protein
MWSWTILFTFALSSHVPACQPFAEDKHCMETTLTLDWGLMHGSDMHKNDSMDRTRNRSSATNQRCVNVQRLTSTAGQTPIDVFKNCGFVPTATVQPCSKDPVFFNQFKDKTCVVCCLLWVF